jgi:DNA polymerase-3 subunit epsilon
MDNCIRHLEATGDYRIIKRFKPVSSYLHDNDTNKNIEIFLDTETTGMDSGSDSIIDACHDTIRV